MGMFDSIKNAIFGKAIAAEQPAGLPANLNNEKIVATSADTIPDERDGNVDVSAVLEAAVAAKRQKLNWKNSIVDLMKALDLDGSLGARKELASELGFPGDRSDSAAMNKWLHKALMQKLADNGGKVPEELRK
ncbi:uncharacterized protein DUF3597 [Ochrobactrum sp. BH3]|uniref:DUF3597 domain-containing protein n=1 Tax=Brucella pituitosa TaxID=571256 RepID=UPI000C2708D6|nr:DUF3597 domain-containing protein [Brucella pituitosa]PJO48184.1 hypothetical protein CWE02_10805 [Brucella pituitosa]TCQ72449.1 uncharacterized protein DUF3597 [Ochrobactrum sp. BH3]